MKRLVMGTLVAAALAASGVQAFSQPEPQGCRGACIRVAQTTIRGCFVNPDVPDTEACVRDALTALEACLAACN